MTGAVDPTAEPDEGDDTAPYDDPVVRTRMAWLRTLLITGLIGLLMWRAAFVKGQEWWSLAWIVPSVVIGAVGVTRMHRLSIDGVGEQRITALAWASAGLAALAGAGAFLVAT